MGACAGASATTAPLTKGQKKKAKVKERRAAERQMPSVTTAATTSPSPPDYLPDATQTFRTRVGKQNLVAQAPLPGAPGQPPPRPPLASARSRAPASDESAVNLVLLHAGGRSPPLPTGVRTSWRSRRSLDASA